MSDPIKLSRSIKRQSGDEIAELTLREPSAGELRGLKLAELLQTDVDTLIRLVPRIASPTIIAEEVEQMHPVDLAALANEIVGFFMSPEQQAQAEALRATLN